MGKCVSKFDGPTLAVRERDCMMKCNERFIESFQIVEKKLQEGKAQNRLTNTQQVLFSDAATIGVSHQTIKFI
jgi:hypothetical protein